MDFQNKILMLDDIGAMNLKNGIRLNSGLFLDKPRSGSVEDAFGSAVNAEKFNSAVSVAPGSTKWNLSAKYDEVWTQIEAKRNALKACFDERGMLKANAATFADNYYSLINLIRLDLTRRRVEAGDLTSIMAQEIINPNFSRSVNLDEFLPYAGVFEQFNGRGGTVPMIEHTTGSTTSVTMAMYALGDGRTLEDFLYNMDIFSVMKVQDAYTRAHVAKRNDLVMSPMIGASYDSAQTVAADSTGDTLDVKVYNTINNMIESIRALLDPQTNLPIDASRITLFCAYGDERRINRVINGQLDNSKGKSANLSPLTEVVNIIPYKGDKITVGQRATTFTGIAKNTIFAAVTGADRAPNYVLTKRALTYEVGRGDPAQLMRDVQVGYFAQTQYNKEFLGQAGGCVSGTGYVVKGTLPTA